MFLHSCTSYRIVELFMNMITCQNCNRPKVGMFCLLTAYGQKVKSGNISSIVSLSWSFLLLDTIGQVFSCSPFVNQTSCAYPWIHHKRGKDLPSNGHGTEVCELDKPSNLDLQLPHTWRVSDSLLDQLSASVHVPVILFYIKLHGKDDHDLSPSRGPWVLFLVAKVSLSDTLTCFYPVAGRIKDNSSFECDY